jgi:hypothetical protein
MLKKLRRKLFILFVLCAALTVVSFAPASPGAESSVTRLPWILAALV